MLVGREQERNDLHLLLESDKSEFVAVYGRRRVGKTFLIREAYEYRFAFEHMGRKNGTTAQQLKEFGESLKRHGMRRKRVPKDWQTAFEMLEELLSSKLDAGQKVVFLDESPWLDTPRSGFIGALDHF